MKALTIEQDEVIQLYNEASESEKTTIRKLFPKMDFPIASWKDASCWEDIAKLKGIDPVNSLPFQNPENKIQRLVNGAFKAMTATELINEGWEPDWDNANQRKWSPWFYMNKPAFRFGSSDFEYTAAYTGLGSRLVFETEEKSNFAGKKLTTIWKEFLTGE